MGDQSVQAVEGVEEIKGADQTLAIVIRHYATAEGVCFLTPPDYPFQIGLLGHEAGNRIRAHIHPPVERCTDKLMEYLLVQSGSVRVHVYGDDGTLVRIVTLGTGDSILLAGGGHGFDILEDTQMVEVKQGPYVGQELTKTYLEKDSLQ